MRRRTGWATLVIGAAWAGLALAGPAAGTIPVAPYGDAIDGSTGAPVALSPTSLLLPAEGTDGFPGTGDDLTLLVTDLHLAPVVTPLHTPGGSTASAQLTRLSSTRAALVASGSDGAFGTADDELLVLDRLGSEDRVVTFVVGGLGDTQRFSPARLASDRVAVSTIGPDLTANTADDDIVFIDDPAGSASIQRVTTPFQRNGGRTRPIALSDSVLVVAGNGPDGKHSNGDDRVHVLRRIDDTWVRSFVGVPGLNRRAAGRPVRVSGETALVVTAGPDLKEDTGDEQVVLLDTTRLTATPLLVPNVKGASAGRPTVLTPDVAVCTTSGADGVEGTPDDAVAILTGLNAGPGGATGVTTVVVGATGDDNNCRPARLADDRCALIAFGPDGTAGTPDDQLVLITGVGKAANASFFGVGAAASGTSSRVVPLSAFSVAVSTGGADRTVNTLDDTLTIVSGLGFAPSSLELPTGGAIDTMNSFRYVPEILGEGRLAVLSSGADGDLGAGSDDAVFVVDGLVLARRLIVRRLDVTFPRKGRERPTRGVLRARLRLDEPRALLRNDVTISVGNASQTIPAGRLRRRGRVIRYTDRDGSHGFVKKLRYRVRDGRLIVVTRGADDELASTRAGYVPVGVELGDDLIPGSVTARRRGRRLVFRK